MPINLENNFIQPPLMTLDDGIIEQLAFQAISSSSSTAQGTPAKTSISAIPKARCHWRSGSLYDGMGLSQLGGYINVLYLTLWHRRGHAVFPHTF